jgi:hypothetical protein
LAAFVFFFASQVVQAEEKHGHVCGNEEIENRTHHVYEKNQTRGSVRKMPVMPDKWTLKP